MAVDLTRELEYMNEEIHRRVDIVGEHVVWFMFQALGAGSTYDDIYDEGNTGAGGRTYDPGIRVETLYAEEIEDEGRAIEEGRQPTQNVRLTIRLKDAILAGIDEVGEYRPHLKDLFLYDNRYYEVYKYRARGRMEGQEVLLLVDGVEVYVEQEMMNDNAPAYVPVEPAWPNQLPEV